MGEIVYERRHETMDIVVRGQLWRLEGNKFVCYDSYRSKDGDFGWKPCKDPFRGNVMIEFKDENSAALAFDLFLDAMDYAAVRATRVARDEYCDALTQVVKSWR